jgi:hypothetical protein
MERVIIFVVLFVVYLIYRAIRAIAAPRGTATTASKSYPFVDITPDPNLPQFRTIRTKIRGVSKRNADGSDRQRIIRQC